MTEKIKNKEILLELSPHLFWDVDRTKLDFNKNKKFIINRVLIYGLFSDWKLIYNYYGMQNIAKTAVTIKELDKKTLAFISLLSKIPKEKFLCYTIAQSMPPHWNF